MVAISRDLERELIPMMQDQNLGLMPWSPLSGGYLTGKFSGSADEAAGSRRAEFDFPPLDKDKADKVVLKEIKWECWQLLLIV